MHTTRVYFIVDKEFADLEHRLVGLQDEFFAFKKLETVKSRNIDPYNVYTFNKKDQMLGRNSLQVAFITAPDAGSGLRMMDDGLKSFTEGLAMELANKRADYVIDLQKSNVIPGGSEAIGEFYLPSSSYWPALEIPVSFFPGVYVKNTKHAIDPGFRDKISEFMKAAMPADAYDPGKPCLYVTWPNSADHDSVADLKKLMQPSGVLLMGSQAATYRAMRIYSEKTNNISMGNEKLRYAMIISPGHDQPSHDSFVFALPGLLSEINPYTAKEITTL